MRKIDFIFESVCLRKQNLTESEANDIIDIALKSEGLMMYYYKCPFCSSIHLTRKEPYEVEILKVI